MRSVCRQPSSTSDLDVGGGGDGERSPLLAPPIRVQAPHAQPGPPRRGLLMPRPPPTRSCSASRASLIRVRASSRGTPHSTARSSDSDRQRLAAARGAGAPLSLPVPGCSTSCGPPLGDVAAGAGTRFFLTCQGPFSLICRAERRGVRCTRRSEERRERQSES